MRVPVPLHVSPVTQAWRSEEDVWGWESVLACLYVGPRDQNQVIGFVANIFICWAIVPAVFPTFLTKKKIYFFQFISVEL